MLDVAIVLGATVVVGLLCRAQLRRKGHRDEKRLAAWRGVAQSRGGKLTSASGGLLSERPHRMEVEVGHTLVLCDTYEGSRDQVATTYSRVRGCFALPAGPVFSISRASIRSSLEAFGTRDVALGGNSDFDQMFRVSCDDPAVVQQVWTPAAQAIMVRHFEECRAYSDGEVVTLTGPGAWREPELLEQALDLVGLLAGADLFGLRALQAVPGAIYEPPQGSWDERRRPRTTVMVKATQVVLKPAIATGGRPITVCKAQPARQLPRCEVEIGACGKLQDDVPEELLGAETAQLMPAVGQCTLRCKETQVSLIWPAVQTDPTTLLAGARLLGALCAAPQRGMYR